MICAATTLAARIYPDCITAYNLFVLRNRLLISFHLEHRCCRSRKISLVPNEMSKRPLDNDTHSTALQINGFYIDRIRLESAFTVHT